VISNLIRKAVAGLIDKKMWQAAKRHEEQGLTLLEKVAENWTLVEELVRGLADE
jgi:hypothetical protein